MMSYVQSRKTIIYDEDWSYNQSLIAEELEDKSFGGHKDIFLVDFEQSRKEMFDIDHKHLDSPLAEIPHSVADSSYSCRYPLGTNLLSVTFLASLL